MTLADDAWYVVATEPRAETAVSGRASDLSIQTYFPVGRRLQRKRTRAQQLEAKSGPAMPGYVFVFSNRHFSRFRRELDAPDAVPHCIGWLSGDAGPEAVSGAVVADLRRREDKGEFDSCDQGRYSAPRWLRPRARVRIIDGPFKGACGEIWRLTKARKVAIWLYVMGRPTLTECPVDAVARAR